ncbi:ester cyclase [Deinococcus planocerae]|uniref:ester cyclase n=1 Tax=Deinococcus planocerae TaxID=1737569 RepID=UPI000C7F5F51|nr:ester cyclase [Deinococcus planocerae]
MSDDPAAPFDFGDHPDLTAFMAAADTGRRQDLTGFDPDYVDIVDYIVRCTHKIWEERAVGLIYTHYAHNATMHSSQGDLYGAEAVVRATLRRQAAFSDYRSYADDVIWTGNARDGFYTSHRIMTLGVNTGHTDFGPPTGRRIGRWVVADCRIRDNRIFEEWIVSDLGAELRQLGYDPLELARRSAPLRPRPAAESAQGLGQLAPQVLPLPDPGEPEPYVRALLHNLWNARMVNLVRERYAPGLLAWVPGGRQLYGPNDYAAFVLGLMAQFPDLALTVDHVCALGDAERGQRVAVRWTLQGTHDGPGPYGAPTGRRVFLIGVSHLWLRGGRVEREWTLFDEYALLRQLHAPALEDV